MNVAFLLGSPGISGGSYVIFQHALYLQKKGESVTIITEHPVSPEDLYWHPEARNLNWRTYDEQKQKTYDLVLATWWRTVENLHRVDSKKYGYFCQSIESRFYPKEDRVARTWADTTYTFGLPVITEAHWIKNYLQENYGVSVYLAQNGIRKDIYTKAGPSISTRDPKKLRILIEGPLSVSFKNVKKTIQLCQQSEADEVWLLTSTASLKKYPGVDRIFSQVPIQETAMIYRSCDVIVKLSYVEGMFGPPLEMFHCGGTCIVYNVTGHDEYIINEKNGLVIKTDDDKAVVNAINQLKTDRKLLESLIEGAQSTANQWPDWDEASEVFYRACKSLMTEHSPSRRQLAAKTENMFRWVNLTNMTAREKVRVRNKNIKRKIKAASPTMYELLRTAKWKLASYRKNS